jgi:hypothetical protein
MIRIMVFQDRPEALLIVVPDGSPPEVQLPTLRAPFTRAGVAMALGDAGIVARVSESVAGRWSTAILQAKNAAKAERRQRDKLQQASSAAVLRGPDDIDRSRLIERKLVVDADIPVLKTKIGAAKAAAATRGVFMPPAQFRALESKLSTLQAESLAIQVKLGELKKAGKEKSRETRKEDEVRFERRFIRIAKEILDEETFAEIVDEAEGGEDDEDAE